MKINTWYSYLNSGDGMDWNLIRVFLAVADSGSLSQAGDVLGMSQPTVGRLINALEKSVGLTLFVRGRSGMELSESGLLLVEEARAMAAQANQFALKAAGSTQTLAGTVRISASQFVATYLLPPILCALRDAEPDIELELVASDAVDNLLARDADIAVRMFRPTQGDLIARKTNDLSMGIYAHRHYLEQAGYPHNLHNLLAHRLVGYDRSELILSGMAALGVAGNRQLFAFRTDDQVAYWQLVKAGAGIGFIANCMAVETPGMVRLLPEVVIPALPMWLAAHQELRTNLRIRRTMDFLHDKLGSLRL